MADAPMAINKILGQKFPAFSLRKARLFGQNLAH
jgi:hypothetical protein